jgi:hypothetical protein
MALPVVHGPLVDAPQPGRPHGVRAAAPLVTPAWKERTMLWAILVVILALWLLGFIGSIGGAAIHLLLVLAAVVLIAQLVSGRSSSV